jgi:hypothetical protein
MQISRAPFSSDLGPAMSLETELITADQKLIDRLVKDYTKHVRHLKTT